MKQYKRTGSRDLASGFILKDQTLAHPLKLEFVEKERKLKSLLFRHFIYVNLGVLVEVCQNLPFTCKHA